MTEEQITLAAMYLHAKQQGVDTRSRKRVEREWERWHPCVKNAHRALVKKVLRALAWAGQPSSVEKSK